MTRMKNYILLHLNILLFSFTGVFSKMASREFNRYGVRAPGMYLFLALMILNCMIYAYAWQKIIKRFDLNTAYANKSINLVWSQIWAVFIFRENLSVTNIIGLLVVFIGVLVVQLND